MASSFLRFLDHTQRRTTFGRTPLDEWSARRRDLYLTTHNAHNRQTSMPPVGFEPTISAGERPQTYALDRAATGTGILYAIWLLNFIQNVLHDNFGTECVKWQWNSCRICYVKITFLLGMILSEWKSREYYCAGTTYFCLAEHFQFVVLASLKSAHIPLNWSWHLCPRIPLTRFLHYPRRR